MGVWDAPPLPARAAGKAKPVFVGRAAETATAEQGWAAVRSGARELIFIGGEPGAGKSRLVEEIAAADPAAAQPRDAAFRAVPDATAVHAPHNRSGSF